MMNFHTRQQQDGDPANINPQFQHSPWQVVHPFSDFGLGSDPASSVGPHFQDTPWDYIRSLEERVGFLEHELSLARNQLAMQSNQASYMAAANTMVPSVPSSTAEPQRADEESSEATNEGSTKRRKYVRKPRPDPNAPVKPLTAYASFANDMRKQYQDRNLSFSDLAKQIGQDWQNCPAEIRDSYLSNAMKEKEIYDTAMNKYRSTEAYREYQRYLADFKNKAQQKRTGNSGS